MSLVWNFLAAFLILKAPQDYVLAPYVETLSCREFGTLAEKGKVGDQVVGARSIAGQRRRGSLT